MKRNWMILQWDLTGFFRYACVGRRCSGSGRGGSARFCTKIRGDMTLGSQIFGLVVVRMEEYLYILDCFIHSIE